MKISDFGKNFDFLNENLASANFAMVMSTGIVSIALHLLGCEWGAWILFLVNIVMFVALWIFYIIKLLRWPKKMLADFSDHLAGPGFLTIVAGTNILGSQFAVLAGCHELAEALFWLGTSCWIFILWGTFYFIFTRNPKPPVARGINGAWLVATVSTQSIVILLYFDRAFCAWPDVIHSGDHCDFLPLLFCRNAARGDESDLLD